MTDPRLTPLKVEFGGEMHRIRVDLTDFSFKELKGLFCDSFSLKDDSFVIRYTDNEGDCVKITNDVEFEEACTVYTSYASDVQSIRFTAVTLPMQKFQDATAPLIKALAAVLESLDAVKVKAEKEDWFRHCKKGIDITGEAISQAADDIRESILLCKERIKEYDLQEKIHRSVNDVRLATQKLIDDVQCSMEDNHFSQTPFNVNVEVQNSYPESTSIVPEQTPARLQLQPEETQAAIPNTNSTDAENEWDMVSSEEGPYASELRIIQEIFPDVEVPRAVALLERYNRDIHVTLNVLAEV